MFGADVIGYWEEPFNQKIVSDFPTHTHVMMTFVFPSLVNIAVDPPLFLAQSQVAAALQVHVLLKYLVGLRR